MLVGNFKLNLLTENVFSLKNEINILDFLPPPEQADTNYNAWLLARQKNEREFAVQSSFLTHCAYRASPIKADIFTGGKQQTLEHVQTVIANFICVLHVIYITDDKDVTTRPLIINHILEILVASNKPPFLRWYNDNKARYPWIPHMLLIMVHNLIRNHAQLASSLTDQLKFHRGEVGQLPESIYTDINETFTYLKNAISLSVTTKLVPTIGATN